MKTILHFPKWFPNRFDPQNGIFIQKHIESVRDSYNQIVLCVYKDDSVQSGSELEEKLENSIRYVEIKFKPFSFKGFNVLYQLFLTLRYGWFYSREADIIHSHIMGRFMFMAWLISLLRRTPLVHTEHWSIFLKESSWNSKSIWYKGLTKFVFKKCYRIFAVSTLLKDNLLKIQPKIKVDILSNVISENPFLGIEKRKEFTFIHVSDLRDDIKNISDIIRVFKSLEKENYSKVKLLIVGDGKDGESLKSLAEGYENIEFTGRLNNTEVYKALNSVHGLILNSRTETFGMVVPEAFACGLPVICAKNGVTDLFVDKQTGIIINQESPEELKKAIKFMVENYGLYNSEDIIERSTPFSQQKVGKKIHNTYKVLLDES